MLISATVFVGTALSAEREVVNHQGDAALADQKGGEKIAQSASGWTVISTQGADQRGYSAELIGINKSGFVSYRNDTYDVYFDVDPHPSGKRTVQYIASEDLEDRSINHIELVNLSTGKTRSLYQRATPNVKHSRWHDVDRINSTHYVVAGIEADRVFIVDVEADEIVWTWHANESFRESSGGPADDWTHVNDVEVLDDGRIMASLRNHDQVVFLRRNGTVDEKWTLGADDDYKTMYEQHQPDYIPSESGGPAVVLADSENDRLVEYQRTDGEWIESWSWSDNQLNWPRDADRLPNNHTLVVDSLGDRVLEVDQSGEVVWNVAVGIPYDAERLGTGDESTGGSSAKSAGLVSRQNSTTVPAIVPARVRHGLMWVIPWWVNTEAMASALIYLLSSLGLVASAIKSRYL